MKHLIIFGLFVFALSGCDKIKHPDQRPPAVYNCIDTNDQVITTNAAVAGFRKVLLEDYTGHTCPNCPRAAEAAESILETYGDKVVVIANHVSNTFARPKGDSLYKEDFRNDASTAWDVKLVMSGSGLPKGCVNRVTPYAQNYSAWSSLVPTALAKPRVARMDLKTVYSKKNHYLDVSVKTTFLQNVPNDVNLIILLTQDSLFSDQSDNTPPAGSQVDPNDGIRRLNYRFDHIVIGAVNGTWGELVKKTPAAGDTATINSTCFLVEKCFFNKASKPKVCLNDNQVNVVAFIYDINTLEVLQVEKVRIRSSLAPAQ